MKQDFLSAKFSLMIAALALALVVPGCGSDDPPTKAEFIQEADEICKETNTELEQAAAKALGANDGELTRNQSVELAESIPPAIQEQLDQLEELELPEGEEQKIEAFFTALEEVISNVEQNPESILQSDQFDKSSELALEYGFKDCSQP